MDGERSRWGLHMFFISWGSRMYQRLFGDAGVHHCDICREQRTFRMMVTYKVFHIYWLFRWVTSRTYARICTVCNNGVVVDASAIDPKDAKAAIPFMDRMGWSVGVGGLAALVAIVSVV